MRTKTNFLFKTTVLFVLIIGTIGCRSNGNGPWYDVRSYSLYNPLRPENHSRVDSSSVATDNSRKPHLDSKIDVRQPEGGYYDQQRNATAMNNNSNSGDPAMNGGMISATYPIHHTGYHSEQATSTSPVAPTTPHPYSAATASPSYGSGASTASSINPVGYTAPAYPAYGQPTDYYAAPQQPQQTEVKNDMPSMSNPYAVPNGSHSGYPITTTYPADNNYQPNTYDTSRSNAGGVASPFANPTGQPTATGTIPPNPNSGYGVLPASPVGTDATSYAMPYSSTQPTGITNPTEQPNNVNNTYGTNGITTSGGSIYTNPSTLK